MPETRPVARPLASQPLQDTAALFALLSATVRLHILWLLAGGDQDVGSLADMTGQSVATVSHHLGKLKLAGLVRAHRQGKHHVYTAIDPHVLEVIQLAIGHRLEPAPSRRARRA